MKEILRHISLSGIEPGTWIGILLASVIAAEPGNFIVRRLHILGFALFMRDTKIQNGNAHQLPNWNTKLKEWGSLKTLRNLISDIWCVFTLSSEDANSANERRKNLEGSYRQYVTFEFPAAAIIGRLERIFYVYAIAIPQGGFSITTWIILKAFFGWLPATEPAPTIVVVNHDFPEKSAVPPAQTESGLSDPKKFRSFYLYVLGNGLSLLMGLACGHIAKFIAGHIQAFYHTA